MYAIAYEEDGEIFFLNHSCMSSLSFGSEDMAWTTEDKEKAELMACRVFDQTGQECEVVNH